MSVFVGAVPLKTLSNCFYCFSACAARRVDEIRLKLLLEPFVEKNLTHEIKLDIRDNGFYCCFVLGGCGYSGKNITRTIPETYKNKLKTL